MSSNPFDSITVNAPGLTETTQAAVEMAEVAPIPKSYGAPAYSGITQEVARIAPPATLPAAASTRLIARVDGQEFVKLLGQSPGTIVLHTPNVKGGQSRTGGNRYVASIGGIVFICHSVSAVRLPGTATVVTASAVLCEGRPLSSEDFV